MQICKNQFNKALFQLKHFRPQICETRFFGFLKKTKHEVYTPENIYRKNQHGLALEQIDFFEGSDKIQKHLREFFPRKGNSEKKTTIEFFLKGGKKIIRERFNFKHKKIKIDVKTNTRNYIKGKKLASKVREYSGVDKDGQFKVKITTTYDSKYNPKTEKPVITSVLNEKRYNKKDDDRKTPEKFSRITTLFDDNGKRTFEKKETEMGWATREFDKNDEPFNHEFGESKLNIENYSENLI